jgi:hypothetical protein
MIFSKVWELFSMTNCANEYVKAKFKEMREKAKCHNPKCTSGKKIEFAHIRPTELKGAGRGRKERYFDIVKHPDDYVPFCKDCHFLFDHDALEIPHLSVDEFVDFCHGCWRRPRCHFTGCILDELSDKR